MLKRFPANGTFFQKREFVKSLKPAKTHSVVDDALSIVEESEAPFNLTAKDLPRGVELEIHHHGAHETKGEAAAVEGDDDSEEVSGELTRIVNISTKDGSKKEKMVLHMPEGPGFSSCIAIHFKPDGTLDRLKRKKVPYQDLQKGLSDGPGVVAKAIADDTDAPRFTFRAGGKSSS